MRLRLLVKLGEWILGKGMSDEEPRADMYLPVRALAMALVLMVGGVAVGVYAVVGTYAEVAKIVAAWIVAACLVVLGIGLLMCWKNQTVVMLSNDIFEYTTFLGNTKTYRFCDIKGLRVNRDSMTLFVGDGKVHIESMAVLSDRLKKRIGEALEEK